MSDYAYSSRQILSSVRTFMLGRAVGVPASVVLLFLLAATMPQRDYAAYVAATAVLEIGVAIGTMGLDWLCQTVVPAVRLQGNATQVRRAVSWLTIAQTLPYLVLGGALAVAAPVVSGLLSEVVPVDLLRFYGLLLAVEGAARTLRDQTLGALLQQGVVQATQLLRIVLLIACVLVSLALGREPDAWTIAWAELASAIASLIIGGVVVTRYVASLPVMHGESGDLGAWINARSLRFAGHAYGSFLLSITMSAELVTALVARYLGAEATAQFGFASRLVAQMRRALPMDLFWSVIRPAIVGRFEAGGRCFAGLASDVGLLLRANLVPLGAAIAVVAGVGDELVRAATAGRISLPPLLIAALCVQPLGHSLRRSYELVAYPLQQSRDFLNASTASLLVPVLLVPGLAGWPSLYWIPLATALAEAGFLLIVHRGLTSSGHRFGLPAGTWLRLACAVALGAAAGALALPAAVPAGAHGWPQLAVASGIAAVVYVAALTATRVVGRSDLVLLAGLVRDRTRGSSPS